MKKFAMILAASAMALGTYSCQQGGSTPKDSVDSVAYAMGFSNAAELMNAIKGAQAQGQQIDSALFFKGFEEGFNSDTTKLWYYVGQMQGVQAAQRFKEDSTLMNKKALFLSGFKKALALDSATRVGQVDSLGAVAQKYYEKKYEEEQKKQEAEMAKQMEQQYGENKTKGAAYIKSFGAEAGVKTTASGIAYKVIKEGTGATPTASDVVKVNYKGMLIDGTVFDESKDKPVEFPVNGVIKGWTEVLQLMKAGEKVKVAIPQELAYGARYQGDKIPPFSTLVFEIELLEVKPAAAQQ